jgi:hypothetical protein
LKKKRKVNERGKEGNEKERQRKTKWRRGDVE